MRRLLILCCVVVLVDTAFFAALAPLMPYYEQTFDLSRLAVGVLNSAYGAGMIAGAVPAVGLTARYGVRSAARVGLVILALTSVMFGLADNMASLIAFRFGSGFGSTCSWIAVFTWITSVGTSERQGQLIGTFISAAVVGGLFGPMLGSAAARLGTIPVFSLIACLDIMSRTHGRRRALIRASASTHAAVVQHCTSHARAASAGDGAIFNCSVIASIQYARGARSVKACALGLERHEHRRRVRRWRSSPELSSNPLNILSSPMASRRSALRGSAYNTV